jgi:hypothetical protein
MLLAGLQSDLIHDRKMLGQMSPAVALHPQVSYTSKLHKHQSTAGAKTIRLNGLAKVQC